MTNVAGQGDITNPGAWTDPSGNIPPLAYQNVPQNTSYPLNGDGRYWYEPYAYSATPPIQTFIGDPAFLVAGSMSLQWSIVQAASDGSTPYIAYSTNGGSTYTAVQIGPTLQNNGLNNGFVSVSLAAATGLVVKAYTTGGTSSASATPWQIAIAITRKQHRRVAVGFAQRFQPARVQCVAPRHERPTQRDACAAARSDHQPARLSEPIGQSAARHGAACQ
jgi:hypothetical protein